jgi:23S rRNA-/tRNA-specific pseudouridylate synthase
LALCYGIAKAETFTERAYLSEIDKRSGDVKAVRSGGRTAVTHFRVLATNRELGLSLIACYPETGRSHQIRVHLQINGLPIIGDKRYATAAKTTLSPNLAELASVHHFLHAQALQFVPADGAGELSLTAAVPPRFAEFQQQSGLLLPSDVPGP